MEDYLCSQIQNIQMESISGEKMMEEKLAVALSYAEYVELLEKLFAEGKTTGTNQSESMLEYAGLNLQRMRRISKT